MAEKSSITRLGTFEPFELQVARGQIAYHRAVTVFGYNPDVDQAEESVWPDGGVIPFLGSATVMKVSSTSANDAAAGTGARTVLVEGLDGAYREITEIVTLNGQTEVLTTKSFLRIQRMTVLTAGNGLANAGIINIGTGVVTAGTPAVLYDLIETGFNATTTARFTVPAGFTAYLSEGIFTAGQKGTGQSQVRGKLIVTSPDGIRRVAAVTAINNGSVVYPFQYPVAIPEKTDIDALAIGTSDNNVVSTMFNMVLVQNADA